MIFVLARNKHMLYKARVYTHETQLAMGNKQKTPGSRRDSLVSDMKSMLSLAKFMLSG